ncbi:hypothetical protein TNCT_122871 [Trichonephila clavata]|uniref:Uncharacterized protein n=1 Tax=Trichonephila clavata TaxID=2740835 RepID=A0A8X6GW95_TRICU|nr:hypothetical protein TNCT_122871 [Trichonephila clavata]
MAKDYRFRASHRFSISSDEMALDASQYSPQASKSDDYFSCFDVTSYTHKITSIELSCSRFESTRRQSKDIGLKTSRVKSQRYWSDFISHTSSTLRIFH